MLEAAGGDHFALADGIAKQIPGQVLGGADEPSELVDVNSEVRRFDRALGNQAKQ